MLDARLIDEILVYIAPLVFGAGRSVLSGGQLSTLVDAQHAELRDVSRIGPDVRLRFALGDWKSGSQSAQLSPAGRYRTV